jgi:formate dehydrogenase beta subunit
MKINRRSFLKLSVTSIGFGLASEKLAGAPRSDVMKDFKNSFSMLNDCTKCIGCRGCQVACKEYHGYSTAGDDMRYDMPMELNSKNLTLIQLYREGNDYSFIKRQCMHCNEPACVSACLVSALKKNTNGIVNYDKKKCIGCRYCMIACPFNVPAYEYESPDPYVIKCDFCEELITSGGQPKCAEVCPAGAIVFGKHNDLLKEARRRIANDPERYEDHIFGEREVGGTSVLYLAGIPFPKLGLKTNLGNKPYPDLTKGFLSSVPLVLTIWPMLLMGAYAFNKTKSTDNNDTEENHE